MSYQAIPNSQLHSMRALIGALATMLFCVALFAGYVTYYAMRQHAVIEDLAARLIASDMAAERACLGRGR